MGEVVGETAKQWKHYCILFIYQIAHAHTHTRKHDICLWVGPGCGSGFGSVSGPGYVKCKCGKLFNDFSEFETEYVSALRRSGKYHDDDEEAKYLHTQTCQTQPVGLIPGSRCFATTNWQVAGGRRQVASSKSFNTTWACPLRAFVARFSTVLLIIYASFARRPSTVTVRRPLGQHGRLMKPHSNQLELMKAACVPLQLMATTMSSSPGNININLFKRHLLDSQPARRRVKAVLQKPKKQQHIICN